MRVKHPLRSAFDVFVLKAPVEAQLIVTRRCNLSCGYCSEYDNFSAPVPLETLKERIDHHSQTVFHFPTVSKRIHGRISMGAVRCAARVKS